MAREVIAFFRLRAELHQAIYTHKTVKKVEYMVRKAEMMMSMMIMLMLVMVMMMMSMMFLPLFLSWSMHCSKPIPSYESKVIRSSTLYCTSSYHLEYHPSHLSIIHPSHLSIIHPSHLCIIHLIYLSSINDRLCCQGL